MRSISLLATVSFLSLIPSSIHGLSIAKRQTPPCVMSCMATSTKGTSCATLDLECLCTNQNYVNSISTCLYSNCSNESDQMYGAQFAMGSCDAAFVQVLIVPAATANAYITPGGGASSPSGDTTSSASNTTTYASGSANTNTNTNSKTSDASGVISSLLLPSESFGAILASIFGGLIVFGLGA